MENGNLKFEGTRQFGETGSNFQYRVKIAADAPSNEIESLIRHTDQIAEIHNTLRRGLKVTLINSNL